MSLATGTRLGPYEIVALLGVGGMGEVYRARDTRLEREVAVKVLPAAFSDNPQRRARFEREAKAVSSLNHPHICTLYDVGREQGTDYLVMELVEGATLAARLEKGALPPDQTLRYAIEIANALDKAHRQGLIHRDLKPSNVMLTKSGAKLMDFGLAKRTTEEGYSRTCTTQTDWLTGDGAVVGTIPYMAPEQLEGEEADARSDLWAFGCVLYEMAAGKRPFEGSSQASLISAIMQKEPPPITDHQPLTPPALGRLVRRLLAKDPNARFQSALDVAFALDAVSPDPGGREVRDAANPLRRRILTWASMALPAAATGMLGYVTGRGTEPSPAVTFRRLTYRCGPIVSARFGPDGRTVYYGAAWEGAPFHVYQTRPEGGELQLPFDNADLLSVAKDGRLAVLLVKRLVGNAYWKKGTLAIVPAAGGAPRELAENVWGADFSPDGRDLAVVREDANRRRVEYPLGRALYEAEGHIWFPRISPDGARVAFFEFSGVGTASLVAIDRSGRRSVLVDPCDDFYNLAWSPDGREIWFSAPRLCAGIAASLHAVDLRGRRRVLYEAPGVLAIRDVSTSGLALVTQVQGRSGMRLWRADGAAGREVSWREYPFPIDITPDGRTLLFLSLTQCSGGEQTSAATFVRRLDASTLPVRVSDGRCLALSPDGRLALAVEPGKLRLLPTGSGEPRVVSIGAKRVVSARFLRDGKSVVLLASETTGALRLHRVALAEGSQATAQEVSGSFVSDTVNPWAEPFTVSPDGRLAALVGADGRILLVPLDGGAPRPLPRGEVNEQPAQWSFDGRFLYCCLRARTPAPVFEVEATTGRRSLWATIQPPSVAALDVMLLLAGDLKTGVYGYADFSADLHLVEGLS